MEKLIKLSRFLVRLGLGGEAGELSGLIKSSQTLDDFVSYRTEGGSLDSAYDPSNYPYRSVGYNTTQVKEEVDLAKQIMEKTKDSWVFISFDNISDIEGKILSPDFEAWLREKGYPPETKILVVGTSPYNDDFTSPNWILHDIVGHSSSILFVNSLKFSGGVGVLAKMPGIKETFQALWSILPSGMKNASEPFDQICDIMACIIFEDLSLEGAIRAISSLPPSCRDPEKSASRYGYTPEVIVEKLFQAADLWTQSFQKKAFKVGNNYVNLINLW